MNAIPKLVVWLDPGLNTGLAALHAGDHFESQQGEFIDIGNRLSFLASHYMEDMALGWEQYIVTPGGGRTGTANPPIEVIGMAKWIGFKYDCQMLKPVPSSFRLPASVSMLSKLGWHKPGQDHANQAARHLLAWMFRENHLSLRSNLDLFMP